MVEVNEKVPKKFQNQSISSVVPADYWDFIPKDSQQTEHDSTSYRRVLSHAQVQLLSLICISLSIHPVFE